MGERACLTAVSRTVLKKGVEALETWLGPFRSEGGELVRLVEGVEGSWGTVGWENVFDICL